MIDQADQIAAEPTVGPEDFQTFGQITGASLSEIIDPMGGPAPGSNPLDRPLHLPQRFVDEVNPSSLRNRQKNLAQDFGGLAEGFGRTRAEEALSVQDRPKEEGRRGFFAGCLVHDHFGQGRLQELSEIDAIGETFGCRLSLQLA
ncbi:MAG: hypothetical protein SNJ84_01560 [Verrucomicrobiia bacterium]